MAQLTPAFPRAMNITNLCCLLEPISAMQRRIRKICRTWIRLRQHFIVIAQKPVDTDVVMIMDAVNGWFKQLEQS